MKHFLDTEFNGFGGELLSLALVRADYGSLADGTDLYLCVPYAPARGLEPWVAENVWPVMQAQPTGATTAPLEDWPRLIADYLRHDPGVPYIISDWPDDIRYLCQAIITGPGTMAPIARLQFDIVRVDAYPTTLPGAVQHNAWWDAQALRHLLDLAAPNGKSS